MRVLEVEGIDAGERHELVDVDGAVGLGLEGFQLLVREGDVAVLLELVALHELAALDHLVVVRAVELLLDARAAGRVQQVERELLGVGRHEDADRDRHEPEAERPRADGASGHAASFAG